MDEGDVTSKALVTTSDALVTSSVALVSNSFLLPSSPLNVTKLLSQTLRDWHGLAYLPIRHAIHGVFCVCGTQGEADFFLDSAQTRRVSVDRET